MCNLLLFNNMKDLILTHTQDQKKLKLKKKWKILLNNYAVVYCISYYIFQVIIH